jgi:short subunit dehydrogenase-like uncharacterized protein
MLYGANGYTGLRIARKAKAQGLRPVLAGRTAATIKALADELGLPWVAFDLGDAAAARAALQGIAVVAHCAGPYSVTSAPMLDACIAAGAHYVDIAGEIDVMVASHARDAEARAAGIAICPGAGFDIIPTDCVAATLKQALPDATHLTLGYTGLDDLSPGTMKTALEGIGKSTSRVRQDSMLIDVPYGSRTRTLDFGNGKGPVAAFNVPWADVATAYFSTGIPNIEVYVPPTSGVARSVSMLKPFAPLLRFPPLVALLKRLVAVTVKGPKESVFENETCYFYGAVRNAKGELRQARLSTPNAYRLTVDGVLMTVRHLLAHPESNGFRTPSALMGANCVEQLPGVSAIAVF